ncbi:MAG: hypothetical protein PW844_23815 [Pantoea sp.]|nr:hypothetical protein [Pantoea sp.]MDE1189455.1 hypothetical protein [Pantoea sp.]
MIESNLFAELDASLPAQSGEVAILKRDSVFRGRERFIAQILKGAR